MMIVIDEVWAIDSDSNQWILTEKVSGVNSRTQEATLTKRRRYYPTLDKLLTSWADLSLKTCDSLDEIRVMMLTLKIMVSNLRKEVSGI